MWGVGVNSPWALRHAFNAFDAWPINIGFLPRGSSSGDGPRRRTIHAFHIEGCGGHVPDVLHDLGLIGITSSDAQGMGRAGETVRRTFAMAATMKAERGPLDGAPAGHDNARVLRYIAKLTINPAIAHGLAHEIGSIEPGKLADIVLWRPEFFGAKPQLVLKAGFPAYGVVGDPNAATGSSEPLVLGPQFGAHGGTAADLSVAFASGAVRRARPPLLPLSAPGAGSTRPASIVAGRTA